MKVREFMVSPDFLVAAIVAIASAVTLPDFVKGSFSKDLYSTVIAVLSIIFSVYFAAFAIIITSSDNDFIRFMEEENDFTALIGHFKFTLGSLFVALIYSIASYVCTSYSLSSQPDALQSKWFLVAFAFLASYSLVATALSVLDAIKYAQFRARFLNIGKRVKNKGDGKI